MRLTLAIALVLLSAPVAAGARPAYCDAPSVPCGPVEVLTCAADDYQSGLTPQTFFEEYLFTTVGSDGVTPGRDGYCVRFDPASTTQSYNTAQTTLGNEFCPVGRNYFSWDNFKTAASLPVFGKDAGQFLCRDGTTYDDRKKELAIILATFAQETSGVNTIPVSQPYTQDGFYFRYEAGALNASVSTLPDGTQLDQGLDYQTGYYGGLSGMYAATQGGACPSCSTYTPMYWESMADDRTAAIEITLSSPQMSRAWVAPDAWGANAHTPALPSGYAFTDLQSLWPKPGYVIGMGPVQLTGNSLMQFLGFHQNNVASPAVTSTSFQDFMRSVARDGTIGFAGGFWYFRYRTSGSGYRTAEDAMVDPSKRICFSVSAMTQLVNGGCNNFSGRHSYYNFFKTRLKVLQAEPADVVDSYGNVMKATDCVESSVPSAKYLALAGYCQ